MQNVIIKVNEKQIPQRMAIDNTQKKMVSFQIYFKMLKFTEKLKNILRFCFHLTYYPNLITHQVIQSVKRQALLYIVDRKRKLSTPPKGSLVTSIRIYILGFQDYSSLVRTGPGSNSQQCRKKKKKIAFLQYLTQKKTFFQETCKIP